MDVDRNSCKDGLQCFHLAG